MELTATTPLLLGLLLSLGAGALSFLSPCVLPIFPAYLSYITGVSVKEIQGDQTPQIRKKILTNSVFFLLGVSLVFISLGFAASLLGDVIGQLLEGSIGKFIQRLAGILLIVMGLFVGGWIQIKFLMQEKRMQMNPSKSGYLGSFFVGLGFAAGWTPCIGPIFGGILFLAATNPTYSILYTVFYVIGFALPFLVFSFFIGSTRAILKHSGTIMKVGGVIMILMGLVLFFGWMPRITEFLLDLVEDTWMSKLG
ncbi:cytochrome c biogenesis CcdA family protein [Savagea faecisuis]|uniref:Cytochrome c biogenesis CcdA family protein n=1 Tax=Savagea faecisuis TaxID=1274803 RepID=A0ABW3GY46_9BACL